MALLTPEEEGKNQIRSQFAALAKGMELKLERFEDWCNIWLSSLDAALREVDRLERAGFLSAEEAEKQREEIRKVRAEYEEKKKAAIQGAFEFVLGIFRSYPADTVH
jgi:multidrug resistance efflux pump